MMFEFSLVNNDTGRSNNVDILKVNGPVRLSIVANTVVSPPSLDVQRPLFVFFLLINFFFKSAEPFLRKLVFSF